MAHSHDFELRTGDSQKPGSSIAVAGDRTGDFVRARRHSIRVRTLRWALPVFCLGIAGVYAATLLRITDITARLPELKIPKILPENLTMDNPHYEGFGKDGSSYEIAAKTAQQSLSDISVIKLDGITGRLVEADKKVTRLTGAKGIFNHKDNILELTDAIDISSDSGLRAKLSRATVATKDGVVTSNEPVIVEFPGGMVMSNSFTMHQKVREATFLDDVKARLKPRTSADAPAAASATSGGFAASDQPIDITAARLDIKDAKKSAVFSGDVVAIQGDTTLTSPELDVRYEGGTAAKAQDPASLDADAIAAKAKDAASGKVSHISVKGPVVMTRGATDRVTSDSAEFLAAEAKAVLTGNVVMTSGADRRASGDQVDLDTRADTALLSGNVVVATGTNELRGRKLFVDRKSGRMQLTSAPGLPGPGRISARFTQGQGKPVKPQKGAANAGGGAGIASFRTDPNAPVDIEADQLDANDTAKVATFRGDVKVKQGAFLMRTPEMQAFYTGEAGMGDVAGTDDPGKPKGAAAQLTRIEAKRKVIVTSKDGQTVTGDQGVFDAKANTVTVSGDVVLSQGQNVVRGTRLVIDMTNGESTIETAPGGTTARPGGGGWVTNAPEGSTSPANGGRPSAVFYPKDLKQMRSGEAEGPGKAKAQDWGASTKP